MQYYINLVSFVQNVLLTARLCQQLNVQQSEKTAKPRNFQFRFYFKKVTIKKYHPNNLERHELQLMQYKNNLHKLVTNCSSSREI